MAWFYRCRPVPGVEREADCPMRFWKDTSGRYLDRESVKALIRDGRTGTLDGFTARSGRTYKGYLELDREAWQIKVRSLGWNEGGGVSDQPEYDVNPEPLGSCPFQEDCLVVESSTLFVCERRLKEEELGKDESRPKSCGFALPRTVCKREIERQEARVYLETGKTGLLTEFTSRFGRPFAATLVLQKNGRHGFEFQPRGSAEGAERPARRKRAGSRAKRPEQAAAAQAPRKKTRRKTTAPRKTGAGRPGRRAGGDGPTSAD
jgi:DNA topoisomerase-3